MRFLTRFLRRQPPTPTAATIDFNAPEIARDPFPHYEALRRAGSVQFLAHHQTWIILGYEDVQTACARPALFSNQGYRDVDPVLLAADPPAHTAVRRVVSHYFSPGAVDLLGAYAEECAASLLQPRMDVVRDYAVPLSEAVAARLIGFDEETRGVIHAARADMPSITTYWRVLDGVAESATMFSDLVSDGLDATEVRSLMRLLWLAATTTTERVIAHCVLRLVRHADIRRALSSDPALVEPFLEEVLRLHPPELMIPRVTTGSVSFGDATIPAGASVHLCLAAANRDPTKFVNAAELRLDRPPLRHFTFGFGVHHCIGATLGRRTIAAAVRTLLARAPAFRVSNARGATGGRSSMTTNPIEALLIETGSSSS